MYKAHVILFFSTIFIFLSFSGCGGTSDTGTTGTQDTQQVTHTLVDPYIEGAILYEDVNNNGAQDDTEQVSSATTSAGAFTFDNNLTSGSTIRMTTTKGTHNGNPFTGELSATPSDATQSFVVSPLTTLLSNGWTPAQVVSVLTDAGLTGISETDLLADPMLAFNLSDTSDTITDTKLAKLQATITIYNFLKIIDGLIRGNVITDFDSSGFSLTYDNFIQHPDVPALLSNMVTQVKQGLSKSVLTTINTAMTTFQSACPGAAAITIEEIIRGSVAISDFVITKVIDSCGADLNSDGFPDCNYSPNAAAFAAWAQNLGTGFYTIRTNDNTCTQTGVTMGLLPNTLNASTCEVIAENGTSSDISCE